LVRFFSVRHPHFLKHHLQFFIFEGYKTKPNKVSVQCVHIISCELFCETLKSSISVITSSNRLILTVFYWSCMPICFNSQQDVTVTLYVFVLRKICLYKIYQICFQACVLFYINNTSLEKGQPQEIFDKFVIRELSPFRLLSRKLSFENLLLSILYI